MSSAVRSPVMAKVIAACFALSAFAVAVVAGLFAGNSASEILVRALLALFVCYPLGFMVGMICERVVREHLESVQMSESSEDQPDERAPNATASAAGASSESPIEV